MSHVSAVVTPCWLDLGGADKSRSGSCGSPKASQLADPLGRPNRLRRRRRMINKSLRKWNCESLVDLMEFGRRTLRTGRVLKKLRYQQANELSNHPAFTEKYRKKFLEMNPSKAKQIAV